jgi:hypothetical protein
LLKGQKTLNTEIKLPKLVSESGTFGHTTIPLLALILYREKKVKEYKKCC